MNMQIHTYIHADTLQIHTCRHTYTMHTHVSTHTHTPHTNKCTQVEHYTSLTCTWPLSIADRHQYSRCLPAVQHHTVPLRSPHNLHIPPSHELEGGREGGREGGGRREGGGHTHTGT